MLNRTYTRTWWKGWWYVITTVDEAHLVGPGIVVFDVCIPLLRDCTFSLLMRFTLVHVGAGDAFSPRAIRDLSI